MPSSHDKSHANPQADELQKCTLCEPESPPQKCQFCDKAMAVMDTHGGDEFDGRTLKCETCGECYLHVHHRRRSVLIHLQEFLDRRGGAPRQRPLHERTMAQNLITAMLSHEPPSAAACMDFGLDSRHRYRAMQEAVRAGITAYELDRVLGDGKAITQLVAFACRDKQLRTVEFSTPYDDLPEEPANYEKLHMHRKVTTKSSLDF